MKKNLFMMILCAAMLALVSCGGKTSGLANEVLSKKVFAATIAKYDDVGDFNDGVAVVKKEEGWSSKCGLINNKGKEIVPCNYSNINSCSCGMILFKDDNGYGYMNTKGKVVIESGKYDEASDFSDNLACVERDGKYGFIDTKGNEIFPCSLDKAYPFTEGLALVKKDGKYGYINTKADFLISPSYDDGAFFSCGVALVAKGRKAYVIDTEGNVVFSINRNDSAFLENNFSDNLIPIIRQQGRKLVAGYMDTKGNEVIPFEYQFGSGFKNGTALVMKDNKVYNINTKGEILGEESSSEVLLEFLAAAEYYVELTSNILINLLGEEVYEEEW